MLFKNLPQLLAFNQSLLQDFEERIENWDKKPKIADIIRERGQFLRMYSNYMNDFSSMNDHYNKCIEKYSGFKKAVIEFEKLPECKCLKITHYMLYWHFQVNHKNSVRMFRILVMPTDESRTRLSNSSGVVCEACDWSNSDLRRLFLSTFLRFRELLLRAWFKTHCVIVTHPEAVRKTETSIFRFWSNISSIWVI